MSTTPRRTRHPARGSRLSARRQRAIPTCTGRSNRSSRRTANPVFSTRRFRNAVGEVLNDNAAVQLGAFTGPYHNNSYESSATPIRLILNRAVDVERIVEGGQVTPQTLFAGDANR